MNYWEINYNNNMNVFEKIKQEILKEKNIEITNETKFKEIGIDSIDLLDFVVKIEEEFNIVIDDAKLLEIEKVSDIVKIIEDLIK